MGAVRPMSEEVCLGAAAGPVQGSAWCLGQTCLRRKPAAMRGWRHALWGILHAKGGPNTPEGP